jgi:hypothetical protein
MKGYLMFRITFLVDDRYLAGVLRDLAGRVHNMETVPVENVEKKNGVVKAGGFSKIAELFIHHLRKSNTQTVNAEAARAFLQKHGCSPKSSSYILKQAVKLKGLRRKGAGMKSYYEVLK